ncbi:MAG: hypothetical protein ACLSHC_09990 [Bilophila wadsworthia]
MSAGWFERQLSGRASSCTSGRPSPDGTGSRRGRRDRRTGTPVPALPQGPERGGGQSILSGEAKAGKRRSSSAAELIGMKPRVPRRAGFGCDHPELSPNWRGYGITYPPLSDAAPQEYGTRFLTSTQVLEVTEEGKVKAKFPSGSERWLDDFDTLVIAVGYRAENALAAELEEMGCPCVRVGDCASVGKILTAIESGFQAGCSIK